MQKYDSKEKVEEDGPLLSWNQRQSFTYKYYKLIWKKCTSLQLNQFIHAFWVTNGTVRLKVVKNVRIHDINHLSDLKELFPENQLLCEED